jgi:replication fork clamp-binding protein CrfC
VALVDTPGTNAIIRQHQALTEGFLPRADLVLFLTSADRPFTESERQFLDLAARWGRGVIMVVNKADLLETPEQREQVRAFVETGARGVLGLTPPVVLISARAEQRGGDAGFAALRTLLQERLSETERTRLKLLSPLNTVSQLLSGEAARAEAARTTLTEDLRVLGDLEAQRATHGETMLGELDGQLNRVARLLSEFEVRADRFIDARLRFSNLRGLLNSRELEEDFRREAVADLPEAIDRQFGTMIDRFVEANLHFWEDVQAFLIRRQPSQEVARTRFSYDRAALLEGIAGSAREHLATTTEQELARNLSRDAEDAMKGVIGGLAGGVGIGAGIGALVGASALDFTGGILAGLTLGSLGLFVLPNKRIQAHRQLRSRVAELREALERIVRREFEREQDRADTRLHDAISPFTRFTRQEQARLDAARTRSGELRAELDALQGEVKALG